MFIIFYQSFFAKQLCSSTPCLKKAVFSELCTCAFFFFIKSNLSNRKYRKRPALQPLTQAGSRTTFHVHVSLHPPPRNGDTFEVAGGGDSKGPAVGGGLSVVRCWKMRKKHVSTSLWCLSMHKAYTSKLLTSKLLYSKLV